MKQDKGPISTRIKQLRKKKGITQKDLAESTGISYGSIIDYENGRCEPSSKNMSALEQYFNVSGAYLRGETDDPTAYIWDDPEIMQAVDETHEQMLQSIQQMVAANPKHKKLVWDMLLEINRALRSAPPAQDACIDLLHTSIVQAASFIDCCTTRPAPEEEHIKEVRITRMVTLSDAYLQAQKEIIGQP